MPNLATLQVEYRLAKLKLALTKDIARVARARANNLAVRNFDPFTGDQALLINGLDQAKVIVDALRYTPAAISGKNDFELSYAEQRVANLQQSVNEALARLDEYSCEEQTEPWQCTIAELSCELAEQLVRVTRARADIASARRQPLANEFAPDPFGDACNSVAHRIAQADTLLNVSSIAAHAVGCVQESSLSDLRRAVLNVRADVDNVLADYERI